MPDADAIQLYNLTRRQWLAHCLQLRHQVIGRWWGLLGHPHLLPGHGLWLVPANAIHTCFIRFPIDVLFVAADLSVLQVRHCLPPWRVASAPCAFSVVELPTGTLEAGGTCQGDYLAFAGNGCNVEADRGHLVPPFG